jgi:HK97 family phage major capsid protein
VSLNAYKAGRTVIVSEELLTDSAFALDGYLAQELGESIGVLEETAFAVGDGSGKPLGIANASSGVTVSQAAVGNSTSVNYTALVNAIWTLPVQYRRNASFIVSDGAAKQFYLMVDSQNRPLWNVNVATTGPDTFLGYPIYSSPDLAAMAASAKWGIFGDINRGYAHPPRQRVLAAAAGRAVLEQRPGRVPRERAGRRPRRQRGRDARPAELRNLGGHGWQTPRRPLRRQPRRRRRRGRGSPRAT